MAAAPPSDLTQRLTPPLVLFLVAACLRFGALGWPAEVVFDEVHFGRFVTAYCCTHERHFDIHPPLGKLAAAGSARLLGYEGGLNFDWIGAPLDRATVWRLRFFPALAGSLLPVLAFLLARQLGASVAAASLAGWALALDNGHVVQSRLLSLDPLLVAASVGTLSLALAAVKRGTWHLALAAGVVAAFALGSKFVGAAAVASGALVLLFAGGSRSLRRRAGEVALFAAGVLVTYLAGWWLHFRLMSLPGPGDEFLGPTGRFFSDVIAMHRQMVAANDHLVAGHPNASAHWTWPLMIRSVFYWAQGERVIYFLGNPVVWWGSSLLLVSAATTPLLMRGSNLEVRGETAPKTRAWVVLLAFGFSYLPFALIGRIMFLYHYLVPLVFAVLATVLFLERIGWIRAAPIRDQSPRYFVAAGLVALGFISIAPLTYGWPVLTDDGFLLFDVFPSWR